jgi:S-formylglutathione hydrolase FrmB
MKFPHPQVGLPRLGRPKFAVPRLGRPHFGVARTAPTRLRPGSGIRKAAWLSAGAAVAALVVVGSVFSGTVEGTDGTLVVMGFDPDRAQLISGLGVGAVAAGAVALVVSRIRFAALLGLLALVAVFAETFGAETQGAYHSSGAAGVFSPAGWILTVVTLVVLGLLSAWIGATLGAAVRPALIASALAARDLLRPRRPNLGLALRPIAALLAVVLLAVSGPVFGEMVNVTPDALMLRGNDHAQDGGPGVSLQVTSSIEAAFASPSPSSSPSSNASPSGSPGSTDSASPTPTPTPPRTAEPGSKPWLLWIPSGRGHVTTVEMPAPWVGGKRTTSRIDIYTPPGYTPGEGRLYPVIYEAPTGLALWDSGTGVISALDTMIDSGEIPATIVVFIDSLAAPYGDTQCADMYDGSQWFETYISTTVVEYVDERYSTIRDPRARAIMGMSAGGFCAPMIALRHRDVFSVSISFSGYYWAGAGGAPTAKPFGDEINEHSPIWLAARIPPDDRSKMYFIIVACENRTPPACPRQQFYLWHAWQFQVALQDAGIKFLNIDSPYTHGWAQVRYETPTALDAWAARMVISGVW